MRKQKGFSLIELLIVVAIILIIAAIAIPNLLKSRMAANEASAVGSVRTINTAEVTYASTYPAVGFSAALGDLAPGTSTLPTSAGLLDNVLAGAAGGNTSVKSGYNFVYATDTASPHVSYSVIAYPVNTGTTGQRSFYSDQSGVIRYNTSGLSTLTTTESPLQ